MGEGILRTALHIDDAQDLLTIADRHTHFRTRLPPLDRTIASILKHIVDHQALTGLEDNARNPPTDRILERLHGAPDDILAGTAKAADGQGTVFIRDKDG